jgi:hypothetical protein
VDQLLYLSVAEVANITNAMEQMMIDAQQVINGLSFKKSERLLQS